MNGKRYFKEIKENKCPYINHFQSCIIIFLQNQHAYQYNSPSAALVFLNVLKKLVFCFWNHFLTPDVASSSQLKRWSFTCSFSFGNRWKSLGARSGLHGECGSTENSRRWFASLFVALVWGLALSCWRSVSFLIPIRSILLFSAVIVSVLSWEFIVNRNIILKAKFISPPT